jgi:protein SCO1/2
VTTAVRALPHSRLPGLRRRNWIAAGLSIGLTIAAVWVLPRGSHDGPRTRFDANFAGLSLTDHEGRPFAASALAGKVVLFNFIFTTCPNICPKQTRALVQIQRALPPADRGDVRFVSITIDPSNDTPAALKTFGERLDVDFANWSFVTGAPADTTHLAERLRLFASDDPSERPAAHSTTLWLVDAEGRLVQKYAGNPPDVARISGELRRLRALSAR